MKLIDKDAIVAKIERIKLIIGNPFCLNNIAKASWVARKDTCEDILSFLDTLEVKEVDLEKEMIDYFDSMEVEDDENIYKSTFRLIAKHFFELGLISQLSWKDVKKLFEISVEFMASSKSNELSEEEYYTEILKNFKKS